MARSKFNAKATTVDGIRFDSQAEARRYGQLQALQAAGAISGLKVHPVYLLQPGFTHGLTTERAIHYEGDFEYREHGAVIVEDVKGMETDVFKLKRKLFIYNYPHFTLRIVPAKEV
ncbi:MAG: hypothetical protein BWY63_01327 [Chloroflexi bacterium ADurb.Bin360]|nr:MAG: hypothetical protein BWY63_01327 [Chloroflexi bacterium ADurb.Bin360]